MDNRFLGFILSSVLFAGIAACGVDYSDKSIDSALGEDFCQDCEESSDSGSISQEPDSNDDDVGSGNSSDGNAGSIDSSDDLNGVCLTCTPTGGGVDDDQVSFESTTGGKISVASVFNVPVELQSGDTFRGFTSNETTVFFMVNQYRNSSYKNVIYSFSPPDTTLTTVCTITTGSPVTWYGLTYDGTYFYSASSANGGLQIKKILASSCNEQITINTFLTQSSVSSIDWLAMLDGAILWPRTINTTCNLSASDSTSGAMIESIAGGQCIGDQTIEYICSDPSSGSVTTDAIWLLDSPNYSYEPVLWKINKSTGEAIGWARIDDDFYANITSARVMVSLGGDSIYLFMAGLTNLTVYELDVSQF